MLGVETRESTVFACGRRSSAALRLLRFRKAGVLASGAAATAAAPPPPPAAVEGGGRGLPLEEGVAFFRSSSARSWWIRLPSARVRPSSPAPRRRREERAY